MLLVSAISTILSAMDEHGALKSLGISTDDLSFETLGFVVGAIEDKLGLEIGDAEELNRLAEKDENILDFWIITMPLCLDLVQLRMKINFSVFFTIDNFKGL